MNLSSYCTKSTEQGITDVHIVLRYSLIYLSAKIANYVFILYKIVEFICKLSNNSVQSSSVFVDVFNILIYKYGDGVAI